jgi:hypothetical protein
MCRSRREFLHAMALGGMGLGFGSLGKMSLGRAQVAGAKPYRLIFCYLNGGADQLLGLDPRDNTLFMGRDSVDRSTLIRTNYDQVEDADVKNLLAQTSGKGVLSFSDSPLTFGGAVGRLADHYRDLSVVRGLAMGTNAHEVGRRYMLTGEFPSGLSAKGNSLGTTVVNAQGPLTDVGNLVVGQMESYTRNMPSYAAGMKIADLPALRELLVRSNDRVLSAPAYSALAKFLNRKSCASGPDSFETQFKEGHHKTAKLLSGAAAQPFEFNSRTFDDSADPAYSLFQSLGINGGDFAQTMRGPKGRAAIALQAITSGLSQVVSLELVNGLDSHFGTQWQRDQAPRLRSGYNLLADMITHLKKTEVTENGVAMGESWFERTIIVGFSEFARTPEINSSGGRDHHSYTSCVLAGGPVARNRLVGATDDEGMSGLPIDPLSGEVSADGHRMRPEDFHATLLDMMGLPYAHLANRNPVLIRALEKS